MFGRLNSEAIALVEAVHMVENYIPVVWDVETQQEAEVLLQKARKGDLNHQDLDSLVEGLYGLSGDDWRDKVQEICLTGLALAERALEVGKSDAGWSALFVSQFYLGIAARRVETPKENERGRKGGKQRQENRRMRSSALVFLVKAQLKHQQPKRGWRSPHQAGKVIAENLATLAQKEGWTLLESQFSDEASASPEDSHKRLVEDLRDVLQYELVEEGGEIGRAYQDTAHKTRKPRKEWPGDTTDL